MPVPGSRLLVTLAALQCLATCGAPEANADASYRCLALPRPPSHDLVRLERVLPDIDIDGGIDLVQAPGLPDRWYLATQAGVLHSFPSDGSAPPQVALDISDRVVLGGESGLLGVAFHPDFASNGDAFFSYNAPGGDVFTSRVSRIHSPDGGRSFDLASETIVLEQAQPYSNHNGGDLAFGPDGFLYFGLGDGGSGGDPQGNAQNPDSLLGKILRIDIDGGEPYASPPDNPFAAGGGRPEIYAMGLRNPWRFSFDRATGELWAGDVGQNLWEEVDRIERGGNYGWNIQEGPVCFGQDECDAAGLSPPVTAYRNTGGASVIAGLVYRGSDIPDLVGTFVYTDFYASTLSGVAPGDLPVTLAQTDVRGLVNFAEGPGNELYALDYQGGIYRLAPAEPPSGPGLPDKLSRTGCVDPVDLRTPPAGAVAYEINHPFWSDGADKQRYMMLPDDGELGLLADGDLDLPPGSVVVKHFRRDDTPIETRLLVRHDDGAWAGYSYAWDADGRDATLLAAGETREIAGQPWIFPGRDECLFCHSDAAGRTLGLELAQLARTIAGPDGAPIDQLEHLATLGLLPEHPPIVPLPALDSDASLEARARAYLHANCSQCHRPDAPSGRARIDLRVGLTLAELGVCDAAPRAGDLDLAEARLLVPGDPARSIVSTRMHTLGSTRMPALGSAQVDTAGLAVIDAWISGLTACP
ncbi:PQQ-dependent sugar dehydrogenase [Nannocystis sp.]|uniref:PQQ-dependent sugar dehydrogenase n=1 Tax=Nannocystis sp. TaxID=1962667 RepID=UPI0025F87E5C|nr:PQQ-dependent sugar dehydrogenase [Nannocystis sp.]MBK7827602.1 PQQ-dependent sugar dehydrogenase [Nannocystis sp.]